MNRIRGWKFAVFVLPVLVLSLAMPSVALALLTKTGAAIVIGSTLSQTMPTLLDLAKTLDPNGNSADIVEILNETNEILTDAVAQECNDGSSNRTTVRFGIPAPTWRKLYGAVAPTKGSTVQVNDGTGMLAAYGRVDKKLVERAKNPQAFRLSEDRAHIEGISQELAQTLLYGNEGTEPEAFTGLSPRYNSVVASTAESADNVIDHSGTGSDNTSAWLVGWSPRHTFMLFPQGSKAGISTQDLGEQMIQESGGSWQALVTYYTADAGLTVRDWRFNARVCNIDVSDLATVANTKLLINSMIKAAERIPNLSVVRPVWYVNRTIRESLRLGILEKIANNLTWETVSGERVMMFDGIPVRRVDEILNTEARIT